MPRRKAADLSENSFIRLIRTFTPEEIEEFGRLVESPFFNKQKTLIRVYSEIRKYYPEFSGPEFTKEVVYERIYEGKPFDDVVFRKYLSNLNRLAEQYLIQIQLRGDELNFRNALLEQLENRNQTRPFRKLLSDTRDCLNNKLELKTFYHKHILQECVISNQVKTNSLSELNTNIKKSELYLQLYLLLNECLNTVQEFILNLSFRYENSVNIESESENNLKVSGFLKDAEYLTETERLFARLCLDNIKLVQDPLNPELVVRLKASLGNISNMLSAELKYIFYSHLNTFYMHAISSGMRRFSRSLFESFKTMVEEGMFVYCGKDFINFSQFREILLNAIEVCELQWAEDFIKRYSGTQPSYIKETVHNYSHALLSYEKNDLNAALSHLLLLSDEDAVIKLDTEPLRMMIYYDLDYPEQALSVAERYRRFVLQKGNYSDAIAERQLEFIRVIKFLIRYKYSSERICGRKEFLNMFSSVESMRRKDWILKKHSEVLNKH